MAARRESPHEWPFTGPALPFADTVYVVKGRWPSVLSLFANHSGEGRAIGAQTVQEEKTCLEIDVCHDAHGSCCAHSGVRA